MTHRPLPADAAFGGFDAARLPDLVPLEVLSGGPEFHVSRAFDVGLQRAVVVKVPLTDAANDRARSETLALARLSRHPAVVNVFRTVSDGRGRVAIEMEYAEGETLARRLARPPAMTDVEIAGLGIWLAGALESAHGLGLVHGDVKPANVVLTASGMPALVDFGASVAVGSTATEYTTGWVAPESVAGAPTSPATDAYSLGALLAACSPAAPALVALAAELTAAEPRDRPSLEEVAARLADVLAAAGSPAPPFVVIDDPDVGELAPADLAADTHGRATQRHGATSAPRSTAWKVGAVAAVAALAGVVAGALIASDGRDPGETTGRATVASSTDPGSGPGGSRSGTDCAVAVTGNRFPGPVRCYTADSSIEAVTMLTPGAVLSELGLGRPAGDGGGGAVAAEVPRPSVFDAPARVTLGAFNRVSDNSVCVSYTTGSLAVRGAQVASDVRDGPMLIVVQLFVTADPDEARQLVPVMALQVGLEASDCSAWGRGQAAPGAEVTIRRDDWALGPPDGADTERSTWADGRGVAILARRGVVVAFAAAQGPAVPESMRAALRTAVDTALDRLSANAA